MKRVFRHDCFSWLFLFIKIKLELKGAGIISVFSISQIWLFNFFWCFSGWVFLRLLCFQGSNLLHRILFFILFVITYSFVLFHKYL